MEVSDEVGEGGARFGAIEVDPRLDLGDEIVS
jgi:hypothetical protein